MRGSKQDLQIAAEGEGFVSQQAEWGEMNVALETLPGGTDTAPLFKGLPDDRCQCPHWGYVLKGRMRIRYPDHEEIIEAGDAYYMVPGHLPFIEGCLERIGEDNPEEEQLFRDLSEDETQREVVIESLKADCEIRVGRPPWGH
jgi:hypothetical protein